jgi:hypothetical protein
MEKADKVLGNIGARPSVLSAYHSRSSARFAFPSDYNGPKIMVLSRDEAKEHTKVPAAFLQELRDTYNVCDLLASIRVQDFFAGANRQYDLHFTFPEGGADSLEGTEDTYTTKDTRTASKTNKPNSFCDGYLMRDEEDRTYGIQYKIMDNNLEGVFPAEATDIPAEKAAELRFFLSKQGSPVQQVKMLKGLICLSADVPEQDKDGKGNIVATGKIIQKHYIQTTESLRRIILKMDRGVYQFDKVEDTAEGVFVYFNDNKENQPQRPLKRINLSKLFPPITADIKLPFEQIKDFNSLAQFIENNQLMAHSAAFEKSAIKEGRQAYVPTLAQAGDNGLAITSDADMQHIGILPGLPEAAHQAFYCKVTLPHNILDALRELEKNLPDWETYKAKSLSGLPDDTPYGELEKLYKRFGESLPAMIEKYEDPKYTDELEKMGGSSIYSLVMQFMLNNKLVVHGTEDLHPMEKPEDFSGILSIWKSKYIVTGDEKSYLDFLYHDPRMLSIQEIGVHPYWLQAPGEGQKPSTEADMHQHWLNLIEVQALNKYNRLGPDEAKGYLDHLMKRITETEIAPGVRRPNNEQARVKILAIRDKIAELGVNNKEKATQMVEKIYSDYAAGAKDSYEILNKSSHHALSLTGQ